MKKITQILCFYNEEKYIRECMHSLLQQTYENLEIIVVDDCSTDRSKEIVEEFKDERLLVVHNSRNYGLAKSRNIGLDMASGDYVGFVDADDISELNRLEVLANYLDEHMDVVAVSNRLAYVDEEGTRLEMEYHRYTDDKQIRAYFLFGNIFAGPCALFRRELMDEYGVRNDINYRASQDYHFWLQCLPYGKFHIVEDKLLKYRIHNSQTTKFVKGNKEQYDIWMTKIMTYAWESRGFHMRECDLSFIYRYLCQGQKIWKIRDIVYCGQLYRRTKQQCNELELKETKEISEIFREKMKLSIGYLYPICVLNDIMWRIK